VPDPPVTVWIGPDAQVNAVSDVPADLGQRYAAVSGDVNPCTSAPCQRRPWDPALWRPPRHHRQARLGLGAVHRLTVGLLIEAEHRGTGRRVHIQTHDIDQLLLKAGSLETLKEFTRQGLRLWSAQTRAIASLPIPETLRQRPGRPMGRGVVGASWQVTRTISATVPSGKAGLRPRPFAITPTPAAPLSANRARHRRTVSESTSHRRAISWLAKPCAPTATPWPAPPCGAATSWTPPSSAAGPLGLGHRQRRCAHHWHTQMLPHYFTDRAPGLAVQDPLSANPPVATRHRACHDPDPVTPIRIRGWDIAVRPVHEGGDHLRATVRVS